MLDGILGNVEQTMFGQPLYRSSEEKAASLHRMTSHPSPPTPLGMVVRGRVEQAALGWFQALGLEVVGVPDSAFEPHQLRELLESGPAIGYTGRPGPAKPDHPSEGLNDAFTG